MSTFLPGWMTLSESNCNFRTTLPMYYGHHWLLKSNWLHCHILLQWSLLPFAVSLHSSSGFTWLWYWNKRVCSSSQDYDIWLSFYYLTFLEFSACIFYYVLPTLPVIWQLPQFTIYILLILSKSNLFMWINHPKLCFMFSTSNLPLKEGISDGSWLFMVFFKAWNLMS